MFILSILNCFLFNVIVSGVRKRTRPKGETATEKQESDKLGREKVPEKKNQVIPQQDPLRWFGILVPQSLRHAQMSFKQGIVLLNLDMRIH